MDTQGYRVARIWHRAGEFISGRLARACGDGQAARRKRRLRVYHRWAARAALRGQARASDAGAENRLPDHGVSHRRRPRKNVYQDLGSLSAAHAVRSEEHTSELQSHSDLVCRLLLEKKK